MDLNSTIPLAIAAAFLNYGPEVDHTLGDSRRIPGGGNYVFEYLHM